MQKETRDSKSWEFQYIWNTASNYGRVVVRMATGLILFRMLYSNLDSTSFGMWALLWSVFGYGILLDFGFGFACQKVVAEKQVKNEIQGINQMLSTVFWTFCAFAFIIVFIAITARPWALEALISEGADSGEISRTYTYFFIGMAIIFPTGIFTEVLRGMHRFDWVNGAIVFSSLLNFFALWYALENGLDLSLLMVISLATTLLPNLIGAALAFRNLPGLSLSMRHFSWSALKPQIGFSISAYLITCSNIVVGKSDQIVVGLLVGVGGVAIYQAGYKIAEMFNMFVIQIQEALSPLAAAMNASNDRAGFQDVYIKAQRLTLIVSTSLCALCIGYLDSLILVLTGMETVPQEVRNIGLALLLAFLSSQITNSVSKRMLMMSGKERPLLIISVSDAVLNIIISVVLAWKFGIVGVALGTLIPTLILGWLWVLPLTFSSLNLRPLDWMKKACIPELPFILIGISCLLLYRYLFPHAASDSPVELILSSIIPGLIFMSLIGYRIRKILI